MMPHAKTRSREENISDESTLRAFAPSRGKSENRSLPPDWLTQRLGEICSIRTGKKDVNEGNPAGKYPFFTCSKDIHYSDSISFDTEAILVAGNGVVGETKYFRGKFEAYQRTYVLDQFSVLAPYLFLFLKGTLVAALNKHVTGSTMPYIRKGALENIEIPLPPLLEQHQIAAVLGVVQRAIEQQERLLALSAELKKTLLHQLFTQGLRGESQKQTEIGPVPESWEVLPLGVLAKIGNGSTPKRDNEAYWQGGSIPWLNSGKIHERFITEADQFVTELAANECHLPRVKSGSLLIAITGQGKTLGNSALVTFETCINQHLAYAQFTTSTVIPEFVLWFMQTRYEHLRSVGHGGGSTKGALTCGYLKTYPVPLPSLGEQREIADVFAALDLKEKVHERKHAALTDLFRTLLHQLMTAQIRVHEIDIENV
jgi:restriction endonuclease S subunit